MRINYLGHSCFLLDFDGLKVLTDPYRPFAGYAMPEVRADVVTCSHFHGDHHYLDAIKGAYKLIDGVCEYTDRGLTIKGFETFHDNVRGAKRGKNIAFLFQFKGFTALHLGDIGEDLCSLSLPKIDNLDFLFIPIGGKYTITASVAKEYAERLAPRFVIPMHYGLSDGSIDVAPLSDFTSLYQDDEILNVPESNYHTRNDGARKVLIFESSAVFFRR